jgi:hypothetical protein
MLTVMAKKRQEERMSAAPPKDSISHVPEA